MRGEPLHLCAGGHELILYTGGTCPICQLVARVMELEVALASALRQLTGIRKEPPA